MANEITRLEIEFTNIEEEIIRVFGNLHQLVDERKESLLQHLRKLKETYEKNSEAERALKQLQQFKEAGVNLLTSNLLEQSKVLSISVIDKQIEEWKRKQASMNLLSKHELVWEESTFKSALNKVKLVLTDACYSNRILPILSTSKEGKKEGELSTPYYLSLVESKNEIFIADSGNHRVAVHNMEGVFLRQFNKVPIESPRGLLLTAEAVFITDNLQHAVYKFDLNGEIVMKRMAEGEQPGAFMNPTGITCINSSVFVCDFNNNRIQVFDKNLNYQRQIANKEMALPSDIILRQTCFYVLTTVDNQILQYDLKEILIKTIKLRGQQNPISEAYFFAMDNHQNFLISDKYGGCIKVFSWEGDFKQKLGKVHYPRGMAVAEDSRVIHVCENTEGCFQIY